MGIARKPTPHVISAATIVNFKGEREIASVMAASDPFGIDDRCQFNPTGEHVAIGSCGDVVCCHCAKVFWS